jgi:hypothetical protein
LVGLTGNPDQRDIFPGVSAVGLQPAVKASKPTDIKNNLTARRAANLDVLELLAL